MTTDAFSRTGTLSDSEKARKAVAEFRRMLPSLSAYARALTGKPTVEVVMSGSSNGSTDGTKIYFRPPIELAEEYPHERRLCDRRNDEGEQMCQACRVREDILTIIYHELAHIEADSARKPRFDEIKRAIEVGFAGHDDAWSERKKRAVEDTYRSWGNPESWLQVSQSVSPFMPILVNAMEDARVNKRMFEARAGTKVMWYWAAKRIFTKGFEASDGMGGVKTVQWIEQPTNSQILVGIFCKISGYEYDEWFHPEVVKDLADEKLTRILAGMRTVRSSGAVFTLAIPVMIRLRELGYFQEPEDEKQDDGGDTESDDQKEPDPEEGDDDEDSRDGSSDDEPGDDDADDPDDGDSGESGPDSDDDEGSDQDESDDDQADGQQGEGEDGDSDSASGDASEPSDLDDQDDAESGGSDPAGDPDASSGEAGEEDVRPEPGGSVAPGDDADGVSPGDGDESDGTSPGTEASDGDSPEFDGEASAVSLIDNPDNDEVPIPEPGTAEEAEAALLQFGDHVEPPTHMREGDLEEELDRAIIQGIYFETESRNILGVDIIRLENVDRNLGRQNAWCYSRNREATQVDLVVPEPIVGKAVLKARTVFEDNARGKHLRNLKSGKIRAGSLAKRAPVGDPRMFKKKVLPGKKDYVVIIGMDCSGSTVGPNILLEKRAVAAQAALLSRLGIPFAIYGHSGNYSEPHKGRAGGMNLHVYPVRELHEPWDVKAKDRLQQLGSAAVNLDGHALEFLRKRADESNATHKIILYYSDGLMPAENREEELVILQREIRTCNHKGYTLLGVGIKCDSPRRHGLDTVQVDEPDDLMKVVKHLEKRLV